MAALNDQNADTRNFAAVASAMRASVLVILTLALCQTYLVAAQQLQNNSNPTIEREFVDRLNYWRRQVIPAAGAQSFSSLEPRGPL